MKLNSALEPKHQCLNLASLGIPDFIDNCLKAINEFRDIEKKVRKPTGMIEDIVKSIEEAQILMNGEVQYHTFYSQIIRNPIITRIAMQIGIIREKASDKVNNFKDTWEDCKKKLTCYVEKDQHHCYTCQCYIIKTQ
ncbi:unnamed protein product [Paramecium sonneborni]|uniref:Uncharacterized protein n=1 Tax=Paramecium sonneborni TaxID=65129 RepID=A0A8S1NNB8_9CILI|nr:unnamed protein product [Paramecium sonneborni]